MARTRDTTFKAVGIVKNKDGHYRLRWTNDPGFCLITYKSKGDTEVLMIELSEPLTKVGCIRYLKQKAVEFHNPVHLKVIDEFLEKNL